MTSLIAKHNLKRQDGVTLLLAILVLAAITAIAFSLAGIITIEIRSSGDVLRTEPALYGVVGVTEEAFFKYARSVSDTALNITGCTPTSLTVCSINGVSLNQPSPSISQFDEAPRVDIVSPNTTRRYLFIDPTRPNDFSQAFSRISVTMLNNVSGATATFNKCCNPSGDLIFIQTNNLTQNTRVNFNITDDGQYEMVLQNPSTSAPLLVEVDAVREGSGTQQIPLVGQYLMEVNASYLGLTRKYSANIPFVGAGAAVNTQTFNAAADFSNTQGFQNWYYMDNSGVLMTYNSANNWWVGQDNPTHVIWSNGAVPGNIHDTVRQWRAPSGGNIRITGSASDADPGGGDGVIVRISRNSTVLWQQTINNGNTTGFIYDLNTPVNSGDQINFTVNQITNTLWDSTFFSPTIELGP